MPDKTRSICFDFSKIDRTPRNILKGGPTSRLKGSPVCTFFPDVLDGKESQSDIPRLVAPNSRVDIDKILHQSNHSTVFRGTLYTNETRMVDVVLKIASHDVLGVEGYYYESMLSSLEGDVVPRFYGTYYGEDVDGKEIPCIMLQEFGESVSTYINSMPQSEQAAILHAMHRVHQQGVAPLNFAERNVLVKDGKYMIVDFADADEHVCRWSYDFLQRTDEPRVEEKRRLYDECVHLYTNVHDSGMWQRGRVHFGHRTWRDPGLPSQSVIYRTLPTLNVFGDTATQCDKQFWLYRYLRYVQAELDKGTDISHLQRYSKPLFLAVKEACRKEMGYIHAPELSEDVDEKTGKLEFLPGEWEAVPDNELRPGLY